MGRLSSQESYDFSDLRNIEYEMYKDDDFISQTFV